jgi:hypothetical protein
MSQADAEPITADTFAAFATFLGTPLPENPIEALRILRREAAAEVERLIAFLDALGGEPDLEDGGDDEPDDDGEPSLGWADMEGRYGAPVTLPFSVDVELDEADSEPSLGSPESVTTDGGPGYDGYIWGGRFHTTREGNQTCWAHGGRADLEDECTMAANPTSTTRMAATWRTAAIPRQPCRRRRTT